MTDKLDNKFLKRPLRDRLFYSRTKFIMPNEKLPMKSHQMTNQEVDRMCERYISW